MSTDSDRRKVWVLDTETKGTGAHIAPMRDDVHTSARERPLSLVELGPAERPDGAAADPGEPEPRAPLRFRIVDVMSSRVLAEDVGVHEALAALERLPRAVDALVFVRSPERGRWRLLSVQERRNLWDFRGRVDPAAREHAGV
jgi:hypothetical protein